MTTGKRRERRHGARGQAAVKDVAKPMDRFCLAVPNAITLLRLAAIAYAVFASEVRAQSDIGYP
jgi:hypothetical protein